MSHQDPIDDPLPGLIAELDQAMAMAPQVARMAKGNYEAYRAEGFGDKEALYLTAVMLKDNPGEAPS